MYAYILYSQPPPQDHLSTACTEENHLRMFSFHLIRTCLAESTVVYSVSQHFVYCVRLSDVVCLLHAKHGSKQQECMNTESVFGCNFVSVGNTIMCSAIYRKLKHIHYISTQPACKGYKTCPNTYCFCDLWLFLASELGFAM